MAETLRHRQPKGSDTRYARPNPPRHSSTLHGNTLIFTAPGPDGLWFTDDDVQSNYGTNEIIYCGYRFDAETQLYYVRNRTYSPVLGRWIQRDPIGHRSGTNLYAYMIKSVAGEADPFGTGFLSDAGAAIATAFENILSFGFFFGTRQCYNFVFPTPIAWLELAIVLCAQIEVAGCCQCGQKKACLIGSFSADGGAYATGTVKPGWNPPPSNWRGPVSIRQLTRRPFQPGTWLRVPLVHGGHRAGCPSEGLSGAICITLSLGIWTWTFGARACWAVPGGQFRWKWGMGVGQGTGASVGGAIYATGCAKI